jgi:hypothetical protein
LAWGARDGVPDARNTRTGDSIPICACLVRSDSVPLAGRLDTGNKFECALAPGDTIVYETSTHVESRGTSPRSLNEAQAYFFEYTNRGRFGLTAEETNWVYNQYLGYYGNLFGVDPAYGQRLNQGNFSPLP